MKNTSSPEGVDFYRLLVVFLSFVFSSFILPTRYCSLLDFLFLFLFQVLCRAEDHGVVRDLSEAGGPQRERLGVSAVGRHPVLGSVCGEAKHAA